MGKRLIMRRAVRRQPQEAPAPKPRPVAVIELITTAALALSTAVAATAVSIGIARADVLGIVTRGDAAPLAVALCFGLLLAAMGALTAGIALEHDREKACPGRDPGWIPLFGKDHAPEMSLSHVPARRSHLRRQDRLPLEN